MNGESGIASPSTPRDALAAVEKAMEDPDALIMVYDGWCKGCALCVDVCPRSCLQMRGQVPRLADPGMCTSCGMCEYLCPDFAIHVLQLRWQKG